MKNIILAYDGFEGDDRIPTRALELARRHDATLHLVHVAPRVKRVRFSKHQISADELQSILLESRRTELDKLAEHARKEEVATRCVVRVGEPSAELIQEAVGSNADLLMVTYIARGGEHKRIFGPVTMKLLRECPCPVMAIRTKEVAADKDVLVAVELPSNEESPTGLKVLATAKAVVHQTGAHLHILHVWSLWGEELLRSHNRLPGYEVDDLCEKARESDEEELAELVAKAGMSGVSHSAMLRKGLAKTLIPRLASELDVGVVVMGTVSRTGLPGWLIGNTAEKILNQLGCAVVAVKPDGFKTTVETD